MSKPTQNINRAHQVLLEIYKLGVREICLCAGARNAPFLSLLSFKNEVFKVHSFFEERSAAFFALGKIKKTKRPVAVITTSGTAAANLLPATIEAHYTSLPLILITSDRPHEYRGSGSPQAIEQTCLFNRYVDKEFDLHTNKNINLKSYELVNKPIHLNVCFDDHLTQEPFALFLKDFSRFKADRENLKINKINKIKKEESVKKKGLQQWAQFFNKNGRYKPLVIVSELDFEKEKGKERESEKDKENFIQWLKSLSVPIYIECLSGLKEELSRLKSVNLVPESLLSSISYDYIIRIGGIPITSFWRGLEEDQGPVVNISDRPFSGLSYIKEKPIPFKLFLSFLSECERRALKENWENNEKLEYFFSLPNNLTFNQELLEYNNQNLLKLPKSPSAEKKFLNYPESEPSMINQISSLIPFESQVFLSNSLPVRLWNRFAQVNENKNLIYFSNRGANGIDGIVSTFLGTLDEKKESWLVVGDLSALYDLSSLWFYQNLSLDEKNKFRFKIFIINNSGGQIFSQVFNNYLNQMKTKKYFLNEHKMKFKKWAELWGLDYILVKNHRELGRVSDRENLIVEILVDKKQTQDFYKAIK